MKVLDIIALILEIEESGANVNFIFNSISNILTVNISFKEGSKFAGVKRFYTVFTDKPEDIDEKYEQINKIREAM